MRSPENSMGNQTVGIGIVGLGGHLRDSHLPYLNQDPRCQIIAACDVERSQYDALAAVGLLSAPAVDFVEKYQDLVCRDDVDAVVVTTGDKMHFSVAQAALNAGKHILLEKPMAATMREAERWTSLIGLARERDLTVDVCHPREFDSGLWQQAAENIRHPDRMSRALDFGAMGALLKLDYDCHYTLPDPSKGGLHAGFAQDKLNHNIVSAFRSVPGLAGFHNAVMLNNTANSYTSYMKMIIDGEKTDIELLAGGRRTMQRRSHGVYHDTLTATFEEGSFTINPAQGYQRIMYGDRMFESHDDMRKTNYDVMFASLNENFVEHISPGPSIKTPPYHFVLASAAALIMTQALHDGEVSMRSLAAF
jgi:hypothetical protein